jgi:hypothetical protein
MNSLRWLWQPQETTLADVVVFYVLIISRFAPEWAALLCSMPA